MAWVRLDDQARQHRKILAAGPVGAWMWVCGLMYCNAQKARDGFIPEAAVQVLYPIPGWRREAARLVSVGLWERVDGGYVVHDYHDYQPTAEEAERQRAQKAIAGRAGGIRSGASRRADQPANAKQPDEANAKHAASLLPKPVPIPSRPDPVPSKEDREGVQGEPAPVAAVAAEPLALVPSGTEAKPKRSRRKPQTAIPADFAVSAEIERMCREEDLPDPHVVIEDFRSKAIAKDYRFADWEQGFRNWMRSPITRERYRPWSETAPRKAAGMRNAPVVDEPGDPPPPGLLDEIDAVLRGRQSPLLREQLAEDPSGVLVGAGGGTR